MAVLNGSLENLAVPGFPGYEPMFGTKKADGQPISSREENENIMLPFKKQRPIDVSETSSVVNIESNLVFDMKVEDIVLTLGEAAFRGCRVKVLNSSNGVVKVAYTSEKTKFISGGKFAEFDFTANGWILSMSGSASGEASPQVIARSSPFLVQSGKRALTIKAGTKIDIGTGDEAITFYTEEDLELDIASLLDTGALSNGKDYYVFLCYEQSWGIFFIASLTKEGPEGFVGARTLLIGGFHTLCVSVGNGLTYVEAGETKSHPLNGYVANDILPASVWCLNHHPYSDPEGMVYISSLDFWCDIYLQSGSGKNTKSVYRGTITRSRQYVDFVEDQFRMRKELLDDAEFAAAMLGSNEQTAVSGANEAGATTNGAGGRSDTANRRMISIYGVEEGCGSLWQWLRTTSAAGYQGSMDPMGSVTTSSYGPYSQSGNKGQFWGLCGALFAGGGWNFAAGCGSRCRNASYARSSSYADFGGRGRSRSVRF